MPDAHNVVVVVATSRRVATLTICQTGSQSRQHLARPTPTPTPTSTPTPTATAAEVEINYYVIEESNCDRQRCGKPLAMAANRFTSRVSEAPLPPLIHGLSAAHVFISHTLCSTSSAASELAFPRSWQFAKQETRFSCYCYSLSSSA